MQKRFRGFFLQGPIYLRYPNPQKQGEPELQIPAADSSEHTGLKVCNSLAAQVQVLEPVLEQELASRPLPVLEPAQVLVLLQGPAAELQVLQGQARVPVQEPELVSQQARVPEPVFRICQNVLTDLRV